MLGLGSICELPICAVPEVETVPPVVVSGSNPGGGSGGSGGGYYGGGKKKDRVNLDKLAVFKALAAKKPGQSIEEALVAIPEVEEQPAPATDLADVVAAIKAHTDMTGKVLEELRAIKEALAAQPKSEPFMDEGTVTALLASL